MKQIFAVVGEDARQQAAREELLARGFALADATEVHRADYILLPLPLDADRIDLAHLLRAAKPGAIAFGGRVSREAQQTAREAGLEILDYFQREELTVLNAVPTAEGCLALLMQNRSRTLWKSPLLVVGYGRVGQAVAWRAHLLGAKVTVAARSPSARAQAEGMGLDAIPLTRLESAAAEFDAVVNTVPAPVLDAAVLGALPRGALVVDLASRPGGTDFEAARRLGVRTIHALSLPARCAPQTAGELVVETVLQMLRERSEQAM